MKICLACSAGGHLTELLQLEKAWLGKEHFFVSDYRSNAIELSKKEKVLFVECPRRNPLKLAKNFLQSLAVLFGENPDVIISTGADTAIPICILGKFFGKKIVFIESFCRVKEPSLSGKIMYPIANAFFVQWRQNLEFFPKAKFAGSVF
jgi:UDP-N-acetylglucosamine:LPS N-acetylglucosamine transferase